MNWIVIPIGTALVLALFTALLGPLFVDWTAYRSTIEANAERVLGTRVTIDGEAELRLLPNPRIRLTDVRLGDADSPIMSARVVELDIELTPLLQRQLHVSELRLEGPVATLTVQQDGTLAMPDIATDRRFATFFDVASVSVANIGVNAGELHIRDRRSGGDTAITEIAMTGDARSLRGPFSAAGTMRIGGVMQRVEIGGGRLESGTLPVSLRLLPDGSDIALGFEGAAVPRPGALAMRGNLTITATGRPAWSLRGDLRVNPDAVTLSRGTMRYGAGDAAIEFAAEGRYGIAEAEPLSLALAARQLDLDRIDRAMRAEAATVDAPGLAAAARPPRAWLAAMSAHFAPALAALSDGGGLGVPVVAELDIDTLLAGGALIRDVSAAFGARGGVVNLERAEALLPGDTTVELDGRIGAGFAGRISASASQPAMLGRWWTGETVASGTMDPVFIEADIEAGPDRVAAHRLSLRIGQSSASGQAIYDARGAGPAQLDLALTARRLALADLVDASAVLGAAGWRPATLPNVRIDLAADEVLLGGTAGAAFNLDASFHDGMLTIDALSAQDIAGAQLFASGAIGDLFGTPVGAIEGTLVIDDGVRFGAALDGFETGGAAMAWLAAAAPALAPADASFRVSGGAGAGAEGLALTVSGTAGGTALELDAGLMLGPGWRAEPARLALSARNADAASLLAQIGVDVAGPQPAGAIELAFAGIPADGMSGSAEFDLLGVAGRFAGDVRLSDGWAPTGTLTLEAQSLAPLGTALAFDLPALAPLRLTGNLADGADGLKLDAIAGTAAGIAIAGALADEEAGLTGWLRLDALDFGAVAALLLGRDPLPGGEDGRGFANTVFPVPLAELLPPLALRLETEALDFGSLDLGEAAFGLSLDEDRLVVSDLAARLAGGALSGDLTLTREGARAGLTGTLTLDDASLDLLPWRRGGAPLATGRFAASGRFEGAGFTPSGLVADLVGEGQLTLRDVRVARLNPAPLDLEADIFAGEVAPTEDAVREIFAAHLARGALAVRQAEGTLALGGGTLRVGETVLPTAEGAALRASGSMDLLTGTMLSDVTLAFAPQGAPNAQGEPGEPGEQDAQASQGAHDAVSVRLAFAGPLAAPQRQIDVAALTAFLNLRWLERQVHAVEQQNQALEAEANRYAPPLPGDDPPEPVPPDGPAGGPAGGVPVPPPAPTSDEDARLDDPASRTAQPGDRPRAMEELLQSLGVDQALEDQPSPTLPTGTSP